MIHEKFKRQLETNKVVTEESLLEMKNKTYYNGDEVKVGDKILFGMVIGEDDVQLKPQPLWARNRQLISLP